VFTPVRTTLRGFRFFESEPEARRAIGGGQDGLDRRPSEVRETMRFRRPPTVIDTFTAPMSTSAVMRPGDFVLRGRRDERVAERHDVEIDRVRVHAGALEARHLSVIWLRRAATSTTVICPSPARSTPLRGVGSRGRIPPRGTDVLRRFERERVAHLFVADDGQREVADDDVLSGNRGDHAAVGEPARVDEFHDGGTARLDGVGADFHLTESGDGDFSAALDVFHGLDGRGADVEPDE
jgi:hypothetical protein